MDARQCMIVDLEKQGDKQMFITEQVSFIKENGKGGWTIRFSSSSRIFQYNQARLLYFTHPETIDLGEKGLYINNKRITNVAELLRFSNSRYDFYHITYTNGFTECLDGRDIYITRTPIDKSGGSTWDYLRKLADETGLCDDEGNNILSKGYSLVDVKRDNVPLAQYLGDKRKLATHAMPKQVYYPFGCNASQKAAVEAALRHQVSIVQGPPGTGKTQTILNIIANLLLAGKTILVVSNNNSAVENVAEKLQREGLGFIVAQLGNLENKEAFINQQLSHYPDIKDWELRDSSAVMQLAKKALQAVSQGFDDQTKLAQLKVEYNTLTTEERYNDLLNVNASQETNWLNDKPSAKLMKLLNLCRLMLEQSQSPGLWFRMKWSFSLGSRTRSFLKRDISQVITSLERAYYYARKAEIEQELATITGRLQLFDLKRSVKDLTTSSLQILKSEIAKRYVGGVRNQFTIRDLKLKSEVFLKEYPVVLSSTYRSNANISEDYVFDYVIMDEASQIDIKTGALALSCAMNAVIVGDDKQLPNVVSQEEALALNAIQETYNVDDCYNAVTHSFLQSCIEIFKDAPTTLLREHYRCHPKIIEFCNQRFYDGELISMTTDSGEEKVLQVIRTVKGNHARGHFNQREIDVIMQEVMPEYMDKGSLGIITPYREQAQAINQELGMDIASTVHKYQGRECDTIIMSMVDNTPTKFSDDANLLNVAISRAKTHLCIVTNGNEMPAESNLSQLINYIQYNNFEVKESKLRSVFDLLYQQYTAERLIYQSKHSKVSDYLSENLIYNTLKKALDEMGQSNLSVVCHYPLSKLIADWSLLDAEERAFAESSLAHVDFLVYNSLTKRPLLTIEVDGWSFHRDSLVQQARDTLKDRLLTKYALTPYRISTTDMVTVEVLKRMITSREIMN